MPIGGGGGGGAQPVLAAEVLLTDAQIKALGSGTRVSLPITAPAVGSFICFQAGLVVVDAGAHPYTNIVAGAVMDFRWVGGGTASNQCDTTTFGLPSLLGGDGEVAFAQFIPSAFVSGSSVWVSTRDASEAEHFPLALAAPNGDSTTYTGGNVANSGRAKVWYTVETLP